MSIFIMQNTRPVKRLVRHAGLFLLCGVAVVVLSAHVAYAKEEQTITVETPMHSVKFSYPVLGIAAIDADAHRWAEETVRAFREEVAPGILNELKGEYAIVAPSRRLVTVVWTLWEYTGGAHGTISIKTLSYDTETGAPVEVYSLFQDSERMLAIFSEHARAELHKELGGMENASMLEGGTTPDLDSFSAAAPTQEGVRLYFEPYQVAPWVAGLQTVDVPLERLMDAGPNLEYWGR